MADGSVTIAVNMNVDDAEKELARLKRKALSLEEALTVGASKKNVLLDKLKQAEAELAKVQSQTQIQNGRAIISPENETKILRLKETIAQLKASIDKQNASLENTQMELDGVKARYGEVAQKAQELADAERETAAAAERTERVSMALSNLETGFKGIMTYALKAGAAIVKGLGKGAVSILKKTASFAVKAGKGFLSLFKSQNRTNSAFGSGLKSLLSYGLGIRSLFALFNKLRSAITDGFKNLAQFSSETNAALSSVKSALSQLKNALATAFAPILNVVAPILTKFINMLSTAADHIARFIAMLTGKTSYVRATGVQEDYAASLEGTAEAAEEAEKSLAGFDEINQLTAKNTKENSGGGGGGSAGGMFENVAVEPLSFDSWGEAFSAFLDMILNEGIPKLKRALASAAAVINKFAANLAEMFTFPGVYDKVVLIGVEIANAFNDFVDMIDWGTIGIALGAGLNLALAFLVNLIYTFDWANLGASVAGLFNKAIEQIDWYSVGQFLWAKFKIAIETLAGFLLNLDMAEVADAASKLVIGFADSISETIYGIDWQAIGHQIAELLAKIDWNGVADAVFEGIGAALGALSAVIWGIVEDAWNDVVEWWHDVAYEDGQFTIEGLLNGIDDALASIGEWINEHIFRPIIEGFEKAFGITPLTSKVMYEEGSNLMGGLQSGIDYSMPSTLKTFKEFVKEIGKFFDGLIDYIAGVFTVDWERAWDGVVTAFGDTWNDIVTLTEGAVNLIIDGVNWLISKLNTISFDFPDWVPLVGGKSFGISIPSISRISIPRLATGAVIPPNREFMAVLGDQTSGNNIEAPEALIRKIVREESGGSGRLETLLQTLIDITREGKTMELDGVAFAKVTNRALNNQSRAYGVPVRG